MKNVVIVANIKIKPEFKEEVYNELIKLYKNTHKNDKGCIYYELHKNLIDENSYTFIETWENQDFLTEHENKSHFKEFLVNIENKLESVEINKLEKLSI
ncbi:putative quinol monooxygenase [Malaciobacter mytili]|uniref:Antibiotic biosynthesis monooxygenase n=1 Tax=Malaciobacter mytili LMG 24559 TaxID=1032238 RepID=A0AAX2AHD6_9BACT|nr:putative quinol monooxygenase [Malaciobacter mytili]AXH14921.1 putative quinol monooxygenase [Malaciobacter mytili LMG 24559]RXI39494.1 antibiotic biosynthesis monooxygenase [Malaciobacter mytili]RXK14866.1 antibiotic biosynthesis monooxygenase [Malaciobacter mytili LMG 24559]